MGLCQFAEKKEYLMNSCVCYGKGIEQIMKLETQLTSQSFSSSSSSNSTKTINNEIIKELLVLKPTLFLNLSMANYQLEEYFECKRCCNAAIVLCNNSNLLLVDLGINEDMTTFIPLSKPIVRNKSKHNF